MVLVPPLLNEVAKRTMNPMITRISTAQVTAKTIQPILVSRREPSWSVVFLVRETMPRTSDAIARMLKTRMLIPETTVRTMAETFAGACGPVA